MEGMKVRILPALGDNYMYLDTNKYFGSSMQCQEFFFLNRHCRNCGRDHAGGNKKLLEKVKVDVYGGESRVEGISHTVSDGDSLKIGNLEVSCLATPCHTSGHICYHVRSSGKSGAVFTGDTLFIAGCGRFFEGTPDQMYTALIEKLGKLPDDTKVYCGHEYTCANLKFAETVEPTNEAIKEKLEWAEELRSENQPTVPSTIGEEKTYNPFMRVAEEAVMKKYGARDPIAAMKMVRADKDKFKA
ncbi:unnamed protein product [Nesidiocoris tenuis]|uniref:hydroxyacylglutathione hydrolase n=1 Tax=Nesidiocoris tenuis TaxID=355587 RepID=A0A6H5HMV3_9HEMI|nr:unnamed protein product [Nesidiocoris tenuis]